MPRAMTEPRLTTLSHGGGCGCKIAPGVLTEILKGASGLPMPAELLVGIQDMGAAGLTSSAFEMASRAGSGVVSFSPSVKAGIMPSNSR